MQPIDDRLVKRVNELVKDGVISVAEMERHLGFCYKEAFQCFAPARSWEPPIFPKS